MSREGGSVQDFQEIKKKKTFLGKKDFTKKKNKFKRECVWAYKREKIEGKREGLWLLKEGGIAFTIAKREKKL